MLFELFIIDELFKLCIYRYMSKFINLLSICKVIKFMFLWDVHVAQIYLLQLNS